MIELSRDTIFVTLAGSHAHGTARAGSDVDLRGVCVAPLRERLSLWSSFEQWEGRPDASLWELVAPKLARHPTAAGATPEGTECVIFDVAKLVRLAASANPNALEVLFADEGDWVHTRPVWHTLHAERQRFLSRKVEHTYLRYGLAQLKRIRTHRAWLLNPPDRPPERADFGLKEQTTLDKNARDRMEHAISERIREYQLDDLEMPPETRSALRAALERFWLDTLAIDETELDPTLHSRAARGLGISSEVVDVLEKEKRYRTALRHWHAYLDWKRERNPRRAELEAKFGYDTKHAMHLVRLMRSGLELLENGTLTVRRKDAAELSAVRDGRLTYDELVLEAEALAERMRRASERSTLAADVDHDALDELLFRLSTI
jgi:predicted nucleotidyltransferase